MRTPHQYIDRDTSAIRTERLFGDRFLHWASLALWEDAHWLFTALCSARMSKVLSFFHYDAPFTSAISGVRRFVSSTDIDLSECLEPPELLDTPRKVFERKLRYWEVRPMDHHPDAVVSPADARVLVGSLAEHSPLFIKGKFFEREELIGTEREHWLRMFREGDFAVFRLTPDKYHYNHLPVSGVAVDFFELSGDHLSCNPSVVVTVATPFSKNARTVTILDTDVTGGTRVGYVAMIEIVALMIGQITQCYSEIRYETPHAFTPGTFLRKGQPKSLYQPGSSTTLLLFEPGRIRFSQDLVRNMRRPDVQSRFSCGFGRPLVETDVKVRSTIGWAIPRSCEGMGSG